MNRLIETLGIKSLSGIILPTGSRSRGLSH